MCRHSEIKDINSITTGANGSGENGTGECGGIFSFGTGRYGEFGEFCPSGRAGTGSTGEFFRPGRAGTGNPEPSYGERSVELIWKIFEKNHHFFAHFVSFYVFL